jgi:hypothetical protein
VDEPIEALALVHVLIAVQDHEVTRAEIQVEERATDSTARADHEDNIVLAAERFLRLAECL